MVGQCTLRKAFTPELCEVLADSGCIAISGGLEVASDRLLNLMKKGVTVEQVARVTRAFTDAGILVHAYLMYGFPTQTVQETVDALEYVRQLFEQNCIQSGFFHRFTCTVHSPVGKQPDHYGVQLIPQPPVSFARNDIGFVDPTGVDHDALGQALNKALYNFMHGIGIEEDVRSWFRKKVPRTTVPRNFIAKAFSERHLQLGNVRSFWRERAVISQEAAVTASERPHGDLLDHSEAESSDRTDQRHRAADRGSNCRYRHFG